MLSSIPTKLEESTQRDAGIKMGGQQERKEVHQSSRLVMFPNNMLSVSRGSASEFKTIDPIINLIQVQ